MQNDEPDSKQKKYVIQTSQMQHWEIMQLSLSFPITIHAMNDKAMLGGYFIYQRKDNNIVEHLGINGVRSDIWLKWDNAILQEELGLFDYDIIILCYGSNDAMFNTINKEKFISQNEHQFEDDFISEVLEILGWSFIRQEEKIIQGKLEKPDFLLFTNQDSKNTYLQIPKEQRTANNEHFSVIAESKAYKVEIDNKKIKDNPHFQILRYLSNLKKDYGILTNGRI